MTPSSGEPLGEAGRQAEQEQAPEWARRMQEDIRLMKMEIIGELSAEQKKLADDLNMGLRGVETKLDALTFEQEKLHTRVDAFDSADRIARSVPRRMARTVPDSSGFSAFGAAKGRTTLAR